MTDTRKPYVEGWEIPLTKGKFALVDEEDFEELSRFKWQANQAGKVWYASRAFRVSKGVWRPKKMHLCIIETKAGEIVDHINGNGLDNRKSNLRITNKQGNAVNSGPSARNTSGYKGVYYCSRRSKYIANIKAEKRSKYLGAFETAEEASAVYQAAAQQAFGVFSFHFRPSVEHPRMDFK